MGQTNVKVARFLNKEKDIKQIQKRIHYSDYVVYEEALLEFCIWANSFENFTDIKQILSELPIGFFCSNNELFLNYIHQKTDINGKEDERCIELSSIIKAIKIYNSIIYKYQLFHTFNQLTIIEYDKDLDHLFGLYGYYLYQDNSPIIEDAISDYYKGIESLPQNDTLIDIYNQLATNFEADIKKNFSRLMGKRNNIKVDIGYRDLYEIHSNTKLKNYRKNR